MRRPGRAVLNQGNRPDKKGNGSNHLRLRRATIRFRRGFNREGFFLTLVLVLLLRGVVFLAVILRDFAARSFAGLRLGATFRFGFFAGLAGLAANRWMLGRAGTCGVAERCTG